MSPSEDSPQAENNGKRYIEIRRGTVDSLLVCEITDYEWDNLKKGMPANLFLNFGIALLSISCSSLFTLLTTNIDSRSRIFIVFTVIVTVGFIIGIVLMCLWWRDRRSIDPLIKKIEHRFDKAVKPIGRDKGGK